jgi:hypothetical protein
MTNENDSPAHRHGERKGMRENPTSSAVYGMGLLGALGYFIIHATSFWGVVLGIIKSVFWPAVLIYKLLEFLNV